MIIGYKQTEEMDYFCSIKTDSPNLAQHNRIGKSLLYTVWEAFGLRLTHHILEIIERMLYGCSNARCPAGSR